MACPAEDTKECPRKAFIAISDNSISTKPHMHPKHGPLTTQNRFARTSNRKDQSGVLLHQRNEIFSETFSFIFSRLLADPLVAPFPPPFPGDRHLAATSQME